METILKFFISLFLMPGMISSFAQETKGKPADTVRSKYIPTGLRLGTDLISIIKSRVTKNFTGWEVNADVDFYRYYLAVDYGTWARRDSISPFQTSAGKGYYENHGHYYRAGLDINFLLKDPDRNMFFIGFRYGHSNFDEKLSYAYKDSIYGNVSNAISSTGLRGHWFEITTGLRVKIFPGFWMGYNARLKFSPGASGGQGQLATYDIPGYGLAEKTIYWGFNYQLFWRIPFRRIK